MSETDNEPTKFSTKLHGYDFWRSIGSPKYVVAPMVDQSELAFRLLCRKYGAQLCYTPMLNCRSFLSSPKTRAELFTTCPEDTPLFAQFAGDDPALILAAAKFVEDQVSAIDCNFGCPQGIARRGHYGAYLLEEPELIKSIVTTLHQNLAVPVTCKVRLLPRFEDTMHVVRTIVDSGASVLCVHGRTKEQKGDRTGPCDWDAIARIKASVDIPVIANGGIFRFEDIQRCLDHTGCDAVMSSEAVLENPALFSGRVVDQDQLCAEYFDVCRTYMPYDVRMVKSHVFRFLHSGLMTSPLRDSLAQASTFEQIVEIGSAIAEERKHIPSEDKLGWYHRHHVSKSAQDKVTFKSEAAWQCDDDMSSSLLFGSD